MNDGLRLVAVGSQLIGFIVIFLMRTYGVATFWQGVVLALMLISALLVWLRRRYERNRKLLHPRKDSSSD